MITPFYNPELSRDSVEHAPVTASVDLVEFLANPALRSEVESGNVTLAMIRPALNEATIIEGPDSKLADTIEMDIEQLGEIAKFSIIFDRNSIDEFYSGGPREIQLTQKPLRESRHENRWEEFAGIMTSGPTTVLLLHTPDGNAIAKWRRQVGHWNIEANRDPETVRGKFGRDNYNNLVHGSDAPESVLRELDIISSCIQSSFSEIKE